MISQLSARHSALRAWRLLRALAPSVIVLLATLAHADEKFIVVYPIAGQIYIGAVAEDNWDIAGRSIPRGTALPPRMRSGALCSMPLIFEIRRPEFDGLLLRHPGMPHGAELDPNPAPYFSTPGQTCARNWMLYE